jgi:hypothetical protein
VTSKPRGRSSKVEGRLDKEMHLGKVVGHADAQLARHGSKQCRAPPEGRRAARPQALGVAADYHDATGRPISGGARGSGVHTGGYEGAHPIAGGGLPGGREYEAALPIVSAGRVKTKRAQK